MAQVTVNKIDLSHVIKLTESNYEQWRLQITLILKSAKLWGNVLRLQADIRYRF